MISAALAECLKLNSFNPNHVTKLACGEYNSLSRNTVLTKAMIVNMNPNGVSFIPTALFKRVYEVREKIPRETSTSIICPLVVFSSDNKKAPDAILRRLFSINDNSGLIRVITEKGTDYIGGTGLIFDQNWNPLMMTGMEIHHFYDEPVLYPVLYVSPEVFSREDSISRAIVKKLIPWYSSNFVYSSIFENSITCISKTICIKIEDFSHMFIKPRPPRLLFNEDIKELCSEYAASPSFRDCSRNSDL